MPNMAMQAELDQLGQTLLDAIYTEQEIQRTTKLGELKKLSDEERGEALAKLTDEMDGQSMVDLLIKVLEAERERADALAKYMMARRFAEMAKGN